MRARDPPPLSASAGYDQPGELSLEITYGFRFVLDLRMEEVRQMRIENARMRRSARKHRKRADANLS